MPQTWSEILLTMFRDVVERVARLAPRVLAMLTLVLLGWLLAALARRVVGRVLRAADFDGRCARWGLAAALRRGGVGQPPSEVAARLVFWLVFLVGLLMGVEALEMPGASGALGRMLGFVPNLIVAVVVLVGGWMLAQFAAQAALIATVNAQVPGAPLVATAVRWLVLAFSGAVALTQVGIAREMVLLVFGIAFGGAVLAVALAFGLGARDLARQALEAHLGRGEEEESTDAVRHV
jgi:hypothetical protein